MVDIVYKRNELILYYNNQMKLYKNFITFILSTLIIQLISFVFLTLFLKNIKLTSNIFAGVLSFWILLMLIVFFLYKKNMSKIRRKKFGNKISPEHINIIKTYVSSDINNIGYNEYGKSLGKYYLTLFSITFIPIIITVIQQVLLIYL